ncbi:hypothetical protein, conserved [Eimeria acervulina]|uniref:Uncharacterized protein n=1 Tax=Eimeria acervulina TaxID=5801 RepID=U6GH01_EIMAC|nr:hypothetical protein, conserved [Eimeria acervulina]CDI78543.1 hypothetical protein, conserved [Eimeria acervulina]
MGGDGGESGAATAAAVTAAATTAAAPATATAPATTCCLCLPCSKSARKPKGGWHAPDCAATTYEIRSSHCRRFLSCRSSSSNKGLSSSNSSSTPRPPKLGSTEPQLSCFLLLPQQELPAQLPTVLCSSCAAAASWSRCFACNTNDAAAAGFGLTGPPSSNVLHHSCSSQGSNSVHDGDSDVAACAADGAAAPPAAAPSAAEEDSEAAGDARESAAAADTRATQQCCSNSNSSSSKQWQLYMNLSSSFKSRFPCVACWRCSNCSSISLKALQLQTASGSTVPALFLRHPAATQTLLVSHRSNSDLGFTYPLLLYLCRSLNINVLGYEYTGYGFCCCPSRRSLAVQQQQQHQQQQQRRLCTPSAAAVRMDIRAAFLWLQQQQQQTPHSVILYSEGRGLLPALQLRSELAAEGLQLGGLVFVAPAATAAAAATTAAAAATQISGRQRGHERGIRRLVPPCLRRRRSETHEVYMQLLQLHMDELLVLEGASELELQQATEGKTPQLLLRQRAAAAATVAETGEPGCCCCDFPKGDNLRRLKAFIQHAKEQQQRPYDLALQRQLRMQQQQLQRQQQQHQVAWSSMTQSGQHARPGQKQQGSEMQQQRQQQRKQQQQEQQQQQQVAGNLCNDCPTPIHSTVSPRHSAAVKYTPKKQLEQQQ